MDLKRIIDVLRKGGTILYPTDTIWGIGCDATNPEAVKQVYEIKKRSDSKSMLILLDSVNSLNHYVKEVPEIAYQLIDVADKPLTIIYPAAINLAENLLAEDGSVGIRVAKDDFCAELITRFGKPIVSTSANISGEASPKNFSEISEEIKKAVSYVVPFRQEEKTEAQPSSIIKLEKGGVFTIIRK